MRCAMQIQGSLQTHLLPRVVVDAQIKMLAKLHGRCCQRSFAVCHAHICCVCALSGKGIRTPMRYCCATGTLSCVHCPSGSVIVINMLGVMLRVCNTSYYLCPCCTAMRIWNGDGNDLSPSACVGGEGKGYCNCKNGVEQKAPEESKMPTACNLPRDHHCVVCNSKNVNHGPIWVPDVQNRVVRVARMCNKHMLPNHVTKNVWGYKQLQQAVSEHSRRGSKPHRSRFAN